MIQKKTFPSNIAPITTNGHAVRYTAIQSLQFKTEKHRRLEVTLKTNDKAHPLQDFLFEWPNDDDGCCECWILAADADAENGQAWWPWDLQSEMPAPIQANDLTPQKEFISKHLLSHWGGKRANAGKRGQNSEQISSSVPPEVLEAIRLAADRENLSISAKACEILKNWAKRQKKS